MNIAMICRILGLALGVEAAFMTPPFIIALVRGEHSAAVAFAAAITAILVCAVLLRRVKARRQKYYAGEGFVTVGLSWVLLSVFGALPLCLSGSVPSFVDAFFETVSGFTTTGASVIADVEALPMSLQYWRSFTIWLGGMGVLVFVLAVSPMANGDSGDALHLLRAESPGVNVGKLVPRMRRSTTILYLIYIGLTVLRRAHHGVRHGGHGRLFDPQHRYERVQSLFADGHDRFHGPLFHELHDLLSCSDRKAPASAAQRGNVGVSRHPRRRLALYRGQ